MSTIRRFFNMSVVVSRLKSTSGNKRAYVSTATVDGHIQELDRQARQLQGILENRAWQAWFPMDVMIQEGDEIRDSRGRRYTVLEKTIKDYGVNQHAQIIMTEKNE